VFPNSRFCAIGGADVSPALDPADSNLQPKDIGQNDLIGHLFTWLNPNKVPDFGRGPKKKAGQPPEAWFTI
jgi:hypothetical protein